MTLAADLGFFPAGTDVSQNGLLHARERLVSHNVPHAVVAAGMSYLPFADCSFSVVLSYGVVYYGTSSVMKRAIREAWRVMRPSGRMLVVLRSARDYRYGKGEQLERNTYRLEISDTNEFGTTLHFLTEEDVPEYFSDFAHISFESSEFTFGNRSQLNSDWIITAEK